eukprot:scaffold15311_cov22-Prasinocladus_malaysianus.AAC.1
MYLYSDYWQDLTTSNTPRYVRPAAQGFNGDDFTARQNILCIFIKLMLWNLSAGVHYHRTGQDAKVDRGQTECRRWKRQGTKGEQISMYALRVRPL